MTGSATAYQILGLSPGADHAAVERAYKTLIKQYHPDRAGGDAQRAAEINRAYFELRKKTGHQLGNGSVQAGDDSIASAIYARRARPFRQRKPRKSFRPWPVLAIALMILLYFRWDDVTVFVQDGWTEMRSRTEPSPLDGSSPGEAIARNASLEAPLVTREVSASVGRATQLAAEAYEETLIEESRACHQQLRNAPSLAALDRCAAFDIAVLELQQRDPLSEGGTFGATAVTARQMNAASLLSGDYLAIDGRLDRLRARVQTMLAAPPPEAEIADSNLSQAAP